MKLVEKEVTSNKEVVGKPQIEQFENLQEAVAFFKEGEKEVLGLVNTQYMTNVMNATREAARPKSSGKFLRDKAMALITTEEFQGVAGDIKALTNLIESKVAIVKAEMGIKDED
jgi:hypothetical protein